METIEKNVLSHFGKKIILRLNGINFSVQSSWFDKSYAYEKVFDVSLEKKGFLTNYWVIIIKLNFGNLSFKGHYDDLKPVHERFHHFLDDKELNIQRLMLEKKYSPMMIRPSETEE